MEYSNTFKDVDELLTSIEYTRNNLEMLGEQIPSFEDLDKTILMQLIQYAAGGDAIATLVNNITGVDYIPEESRLPVMCYLLREFQSISQKHEALIMDIVFNQTGEKDPFTK